MLHFIRDSLFPTDSPLHHGFSISLENLMQSASQVDKVSGFHAFLVIFTACCKRLQILKPRSSNWNNALMRCRQQQQILLPQLITESTLCSPRGRMQLKLL